MEIEKKATKTRVSEVIGYILLTPPIVSVLLFFLQFIHGKEEGLFLSFLDTAWSGYWSAASSGGGGYTSALPIYLGLMAIAGASLIKR